MYVFNLTKLGNVIDSTEKKKKKNFMPIFVCVYVSLEMSLKRWSTQENSYYHQQYATNNKTVIDSHPMWSEQQDKQIDN